jgi:parallel beta-helix repeat protein
MLVLTSLIAPVFAGTSNFRKEISRATSLPPRPLSSPGNEGRWMSICWHYYDIVTWSEPTLRDNQFDGTSPNDASARWWMVSMPEYVNTNVGVGPWGQPYDGMSDWVGETGQGATPYYSIVQTNGFIPEPIPGEDCIHILERDPNMAASYQPDVYFDDTNTNSVLEEIGTGNVPHGYIWAFRQVIGTANDQEVCPLSSNPVTDWIEVIEMPAVTYTAGNFYWAGVMHASNQKGNTNACIESWELFEGPALGDNNGPWTLKGTAAFGSPISYVANLGYCYCARVIWTGGVQSLVLSGPLTISTEPMIYNTCPPDGATSVNPIPGTYIIQFNKAMNTTVGVISTNLPNVSWAWSTDGLWLNGTYSMLQNYTTYYVDLTGGGFIDLEGNPLTEDTYKCFTTGNGIYETPFRINSNVEFGNMAAVRGWLGDGSQGNPYIIDNYNINGSGYGYCIYVGNTTCYFKIQNCYLHHASGNPAAYFADTGIYIYSTQNGNLTNNIAESNSGYGIHLSTSSSNNQIINNTVSSNAYNGIYLYSSCNNKINNNTVSSNSYNIQLDVSSNNNIINGNNVFSSIGYDGIAIYSSSYCTITNNTVSANQRYGIAILKSYGHYTSQDNKICSNSLINNINQAYDDQPYNHWNTSYPIGGNYWYNYNDPDIFSGPNQDQPGSDGIGDTPYIIDANSQDRYPLMSPTIQIPIVNVTQPSSAVTWYTESSHEITWTVALGLFPLATNPISIYYSITGSGGPWLLLSNGEPNDGTFTWTVNNTPSTNCYVRVEAVDIIGFSGFDISDTAFTIEVSYPLPATNVHAELTGTNDVTVYWTASASPDVAYYHVYYVSNDWNPTGDSYSFLANTTGTSFTHAGYGNYSGSETYYQIRTFDTAGHETRTIIQAAKYTKLISASTTVSWGGWIMLGSSLNQSSYVIDYKLQGQGFGALGYYNWSAVELYNACDSQDSWKLNVRNATPNQNEITTINNTQGFWACVYNNARYTSAGYVSNLTIPLKAGWNLVPYPFAARFQSTQYIRDHLIANCPGFGGTFGDMEIFNKTAGYRTSTPTGTEILTHQDAFWVCVTYDCTWTVINY